ncbi:MAG: hypothetical protein Q8N12_04580 [Thermodesulfovibrionales bacterium]|nr:hypothetical protein [Nitrospinota bacterium]MCG2708988.1 hypothetical protein [Thermodesulfovibrionales bacterium]MDP3048690.1 hypothetical protein [Thermodesulfovibrionales bacterium]
MARFSKNMTESPSIYKKFLNALLKMFIQKIRQKDILSLFGKIEMKESYDYKRERRDRHSKTF